MTNRTYPYTAWVLQPSFKPKQVVFVKNYQSWGNEDYGDVTDTGKLYAMREVHATKQAAIAHGRLQLDKQLADLEKRQLSFSKRKAALDAAEESL